MRKFTVLLVVVFLCVATLPAFGAINIFANPQVGDTVYFSTENAGDNSGGPFTGHLGSVNWSTFCVEADGCDEYFSPNTLYTVLNTSAAKATGTGNFVTNAAKWLYWMYGTNQAAITGMIDATTYTYNNDLVDDRTSLQEAIWHGVLQGYGNTGQPLSTLMDNAAWAWYDTALAAIGGVGELDDPNNPIYGLVRVVNPGYYSGQTEAQSQLYAIPEPASLFVWSLFMAGGSCLGMWVWRRRR